MSKRDHPPKKPKVPLEPVVGLMAKGAKTVTLVKHGASKGPMKALPTNQEKPPVLLHEDSKPALEQLSSIISLEDYEDLDNHSSFCNHLGNHARQLYVHPFQLAFHLTPLFLVFQAMVMMKGLMGQCLTHETALECVQAKAELTEDELNQLQG